jgi:sporulation protein YlmC with PRC-barrel domain
MAQSTYGREPNYPAHTPRYRDADDIPLERDLEHRYRVRSGDYEEDRGWTGGLDSSLIGVLGVVLGAGALAAWYGTRGGSHDQRSGSGRQISRRQRLPTDETDELIASNKVEGTAVYNRNGDKIGTVQNFMVGKRSGRVAYAVLSFGGFLGFGGSYHPLPWSALTYDSGRGGYVVDVDPERLKNAPRHAEQDNPFSNPGYGRQVTEYWLLLG